MNPPCWRKAAATAAIFMYGDDWTDGWVSASFGSGFGCIDCLFGVSNVIKFSVDSVTSSDEIFLEI